MKMGGKQRAEMTGEGWREEKDSAYSHKINISISISVSIRIKPARRHREAIFRRRHGWMMIYVVENLGWGFFFSFFFFLFSFFSSLDDTVQIIDLFHRVLYGRC